jgi:hypothetical protein
MEKAAKPSRGDMVSWNSSGGRATGKIERIVREGSLDVPNSSFTINAEPDDPAVLIRVYRNDRPTSVMVGHKMSSLNTVAKANPYRDRNGRFSSGSGGSVVAPKPAGSRPSYRLQPAKEMRYGGGSGLRMATDSKGKEHQLPYRQDLIQRGQKAGPLKSGQGFEMKSSRTYSTPERWALQRGQFGYTLIDGHSGETYPSVGGSVANAVRESNLIIAGTLDWEASLP